MFVFCRHQPHGSSAVSRITTTIPIGQTGVDNVQQCYKSVFREIIDSVLNECCSRYKNLKDLETQEANEQDRRCSPPTMNTRNTRGVVGINANSEQPVADEFLQLLPSLSRGNCAIGDPRPLGRPGGARGAGGRAAAIKLAHRDYCPRVSLVKEIPISVANFPQSRLYKCNRGGQFGHLVRTYQGLSRAQLPSD
ncbi:hypothetical protein EVAR_15894_1 [Eumeta japonica]|uniref:Uncharacterized protein n=1 Tax=Eumeta variegata TaxID=151549 RepID=A0A4C1UE88_EUMVA|nr:hypothetical protein EVAR_15894_1 [Eumeta japonica]